MSEQAGKEKKRLVVLVSESTDRKIRDESEETGAPLSAIVERALRDRYSRREDKRPSAVAV